MQQTVIIGPQESVNNTFETGRSFLRLIFRGVNILSNAIPVTPDTPIFLSVDEQLGNRERNIFFSQIPHDGVIAAGKVDIGKGDVTNV